MTRKEQLNHECPECMARPGMPCKLYNGDPLEVPHKVRGPGKLAEHLQKEIDRKEERFRKQYGPLFQHVADAEIKLPTVAELALQKRYDAARAAEDRGMLHQANRGLEWIRLRWIKREIASMIGEESAELIWQYAVNVFSSSESYVENFIQECVTTCVPHSLKYELRYDQARINKYNPDGRFLVTVEHWPPPNYVPPMTREQYLARFPRLDHRYGDANAAEPDDGGLFEKLLSINRPMTGQANDDNR